MIHAGDPAVAPPLLLIAGPTATGKTALAIEVALALRSEGVPVEIISADSRQVYRGLDTAALPSDPTIRAGIEEQLAEHGVEAEAGRLRSLAPSLAARVDLKNPRRVARALEIAEIAGDAPLPRARPYAGRVSWLGL